MNFVFIAGHLGADPETRFTQSGKKVTTLRVATNGRKGGQDVTVWWRATIWGEQFDKMLPFFKKGSAVMVQGELQKPEIFNDREGKPQISLEITVTSLHFAPFGRGEREGGSGGGQHQQQDEHSQDQQQQGRGYPQKKSPEGAPVSPYAKAPANAPQGGTFDDEVPF